MVHMKWSKCPAADNNHLREKRVILVLHLRSSLDMIVKYLEFLQFILGLKMINRLFELMRQSLSFQQDVMEMSIGCFMMNLVIKNDYGVYLICDGEYLRSPELICPHKHEAVSSRKGYVSSKIESICKDVECVLGF